MLSQEALAALSEHLGADVSVDDIVNAQSTGGGRGLRKLAGETAADDSDDSDTLEIPWVEGGASVAPPCHVSSDTVPAIIDFLRIQPHDVLYDLGCGDGRVCIAGVAAGAAAACGVEIEEALIVRFQERIQAAEVAEQIPIGAVRALHSDLRAQTLEDATLVYCYLLPEVFPLIQEILLTVLKRGGTIVCNTWGPDSWEPVEIVEVSDVTLRRYTMQSVAATVRVVLGTMTMGPAVGDTHNKHAHSPLPSYCQTPPEVALAQLQMLVSAPHARVTSGPEAGKVMIDTASIYQDWCTESTLGAILKEHPQLREQISIHTKANSALKPHRSLSAASVLYQAEGSLERLGVDSVDIYYLHSPDINTPIADTLDAIEQLHTSGKIKVLRLCYLSNRPEPDGGRSLDFLTILLGRWSTSGISATPEE